jgi:glycerophosphoryl diester phosphodiesterase
MPAVRSRRPLVLAHRGASAVAAEHTLAAYRAAIDCGADGVECDVRLTRDRVLVCVHDRRVDRTSSGRGVVSTLELADLAELDFGSRDRPDPLLSADWEAPDLDRSQVLTLERLVETVLTCGRSIRLLVETKHPTRYAGLVEVALCELLTRFGLDRPGATSVRAQVMSFAGSSLRRVHALAPQVPTVLLFRRLAPQLRDGRAGPRVPVLGPGLPVLRRHPGLVARAHAGGRRVFVWTVDDPTDVDYVTALGVDGIITNRPAAVLHQLRSTLP